MTTWEPEDEAEFQRKAKMTTDRDALVKRLKSAYNADLPLSYIRLSHDTVRETIALLTAPAEAQAVADVVTVDSGPLRALFDCIAHLEVEQDAGWTPDAQSHLRRASVFVNMITPTAPPSATIRRQAIEEAARHCLKGLVSEESGQMRTPGTIKREAYNAAIHECANSLFELAAHPAAPACALETGSMATECPRCKNDVLGKCNYPAEPGKET